MRRGASENDTFKISACYLSGCVWRRWRTGCLTEKLMIMYSSSITCHERRLTTSLFFIGFGQSPAERETDRNKQKKTYKSGYIVEDFFHNFSFPLSQPETQQVHPCYDGKYAGGTKGHSFFIAGGFSSLERFRQKTLE